MKNRHLRKTVAAVSVLMLLSALLFSSCSLLPEEETFADTPTVMEYQGAVYKTGECKVADVILSERLMVSYVPLRTTELSFDISGSAYGEFYVTAGDEVKEGDVLVELDLGDLKSQIESYEKQRDNLEFSLKQSEEKRVLALKRSEAASESLSEEDRKAALDEVNSRYDQMEQSLNDRLYIAELRIEDLKEKISERQITAPFDGAVTYAYSPAAGEVTSRGKVIIRMADASMTLFRGMTENWDKVEVGAEYTVVVMGIEYKVHAATEEMLKIPETEHEPGKKGYVYFVSDEMAGDFSDNSSGVVVLILEEKDQVLCVPNDAISTINDKTVVYYPMKSGIRNYREIQIGVVGNTLTEVLSGVEEGEVVIIK